MVKKRVSVWYEDWYFPAEDEDGGMWGIFENPEPSWAGDWLACFAREEDADLFLKAKGE